ncbi:hypothetical protein [Corynebacterium sp. ZY180755]
MAPSNDEASSKRNEHWAYYNEASNRFKGPFHKAIGAEAFHPESLEDAGSKARCYHKILGSQEFNLPILSAESTAYLKSIELIQYRDSLSADNSLGTSTDIVTRYLVLNVWGENLSSFQLAKLSEGLERPRNGMLIETEASDDLLKYCNDEFNPQWFKPLPYFMDKALSELKRGFTASGYDAPSLKLKAGGFLVPTAASAPSDSLPVRLSPLRVAMAIPGNSAARTEPKLLSDAKGKNSPAEWTPELQWAWLLSTGSDTFVANIPSQKLSNAEKSAITSIETWTMWASEEGISAVRSCPPSNVSPRYWSIVTTRYLDLMILLLRTTIVMDKLTEDLSMQAMRFNHEMGKIGTLEDSQVDEAKFKVLNDAYDKLQSIQQQFLAFRNDLWFNSVPKQSVDSEVFLKTRQALGLDVIYQDFLDEMASRATIYETSHSMLRLERENKRKKDRELDRDKKEKVAEKQNTLLSIITAALGGGALAEALGLYRDSVPWLGMVTGSLTIMAIVGWVVWVVMSKSKNEKQ